MSVVLEGFYQSLRNDFTRVFFFALGLGTALQTSFFLDVYMNSLEAVRVQRKDHFGGILGNVRFNVLKLDPHKRPKVSRKSRLTQLQSGPS